MQCDAPSLPTKLKSLSSVSPLFIEPHRSVSHFHTPVFSQMVAVVLLNLNPKAVVESVQDAVGDLLGDMAGPGMRPINRRQRIMQSRGTRALGESQAATAIAAGPAAPSSQHR